MLHMLDTDMASYIIKGRSPTLAEKLRAHPPSQLCVSVMTQAELLYGLKRLPPASRLHLAVRQFLRIVRVRAWGSDAAAWYADIRHQLAAQGRSIGELDMMIAAHALSADATLVTNDTRHYARIEAPLTIVNWAEA